MKKNVLVLLSLLFIVSCVSQPKEQAKLAKQSEEKAKVVSKAKRNCHANTTGSRVKRC